MVLGLDRTLWWAGYLYALVNVSKYVTGDEGESFDECVQLLFVEAVRAIALEGYSIKKHPREERG